MIQGNSCADLLLTARAAIARYRSCPATRFERAPDPVPRMPGSCLHFFLFAVVSVARLAWPLQQIGRTGTRTCAPIWVGLACAHEPGPGGEKGWNGLCVGGQKQTGGGSKGLWGRRQMRLRILAGTRGDEIRRGVGSERCACAAYWAGGALVLARALHLRANFGSHARGSRRATAGHPSRALQIFFL